MEGEMTTADTIATALRPIAPGGKLKPSDIPLIDQLASMWDARLVAAVSDVRQNRTTADGEPAWLVEARKLVGTREIPGPQHNSWIAKGWARLGAGWFNDDETPWCGLFAAHCMEAAGQPYPGKGMFARAKSWAAWGKECQPRLGCVAVFGRQGGGHVGFAVGQSATHLYVLGGNQSNAVNIMPIAKSRLLATRWPAGLALSDTPLPRMAGGTVSGNEQ
jgi:uncharacterized protein (TIGR02594 family)